MFMGCSTKKYGPLVKDKYDLAKSYFLANRSVFNLKIIRKLFQQPFSIFLQFQIHFLKRGFPKSNSAQSESAS